ncbi:unnamed protein product [Umbelopsis vinacea]
MSYIDENPLSQVYVNRNTGYYQRYIGSENEHTVPTTTPSPNHRPDILPPPSDSIVAHVPKPTIFDSRQCPGASLMSSFSTKASSTALKRYKCAPYRRASSSNCKGMPMRQDYHKPKVFATLQLYASVL